jgi:hypothetical protein
MPMDMKSGHTTSFSVQWQQSPHDKLGGSMLGEQKEKTKIISNGPQCCKCKGFGHYVVVCLIRDR